MSRRSVLIIVLALIGVPAAVAGVEAIAFYSANRSTHTLQSSGVTREYRLHVPASYDASRPTPLVISLHGAGMWPAAQQRTSQWDRVADREGFIVAYPSGFSGRGPRIWQVTAGPSHRRDVTFISDLIDEVSRSYNIDAHRIYANGFSNGGGMSFVLSCTLSDRIAAVGLVDAALTLPASWCRDDRPVPMIAFHGNSGEAAPYKGGSSWVSVGRPIFQDVEAFMASWARRNRCVGKPAVASAASDATRIAYEDCASGAPVILYRLEGGGHTWPGGGHIAAWFVGSTNRNIDASTVMWDFFKQHPLSR
ncbi:MAG TPA: PHB depolymerase family esterase [Vicinamibacterales bacterium]